MNSVRSNLILFYTICSKDIGIKKLEFVLCTLCSIFLIPISLQPDYVDLLRFKLWTLWFVRSKIILFQTIRLQRYKKEGIRKLELVTSVPSFTKAGLFINLLVATVVYCLLLSTVYCLLSTVYCLLSTVYNCLLSNVYCLPTNFYLMHVFFELLFRICKSNLDVIGLSR